MTPVSVAVAFRFGGGQPWFNDGETMIEIGMALGFVLLTDGVGAN